MAEKGHPPTKHFLDTSVVRPLLHGTTAYKAYFAKVFGDDPCDISQYVLMEFRRGFLLPLVGFYFYLTMPTIETIGDALTLWSQKFGKGELKAVVQLIGGLLDAQELNSAKPQDLAKAQLAVGRYVKRLDAKLRGRFKDLSKDTTQCARARVALKVDLERLSDDLGKFSEGFKDTVRCRSLCRIDDFILRRYRKEISDYAAQAAKLAKNREAQGFLAIAEHLQKVLNQGEQVCSCAHCAKIGDAVIALDADRAMQVEHTDLSFEHLCPPIKQPHQLHPSEMEVHQRAKMC